MTIGRTSHPCEEEVVPEGKRLRMKDWLKSRIGDPRYPGLVWLDEKMQEFRIPWKHAALHGWNQNSDGALFRDWAEHTGACIRNAHPKQLKATFRCALHSLPDVHEERTRAKKRGDDACRVYRFDSTSSAPRRRHIRIRNHKDKSRRQNTNRRAHATYLQRTISSQSTSTQYSTWGKSLQSEMLQTDNGFKMPLFLADQKLPCGYQKFWAGQSSPHMSIDTHSYPDTGCNTFHSAESLPLPEIIPTYFPESQRYLPAQGMWTYSTGETFQPKAEEGNESFFFGANFNNSRSPANSDFSQTHCTISVSPSLPPQDGACINTVPQLCHPIDTIAEVVGSASATVVDYQNTDAFRTFQDQGNSRLFDEKLLGPADAVIASGALQVAGRQSEEIAHALEIPGTSPHNATARDYQLSRTSLSEESNQIYIGDQPLSVHMLGDESPDEFSSGHPEYIAARSITGQYVTEAPPAENVNPAWIASPHHDSFLPAASTLLSPSSTANKRPLRWISNDEGDARSQSQHCYNVLQYDVCEYSSNNIRPGDNHHTTTLAVQDHEGSSTCTGYSSL